MIDESDINPFHRKHVTTIVLLRTRYLDSAEDDLSNYVPPSCTMAKYTSCRVEPDNHCLRYSHIVGPDPQIHRTSPTCHIPRA
jgi:ribonuclease BN (tRNA processing enzyme)